MRWLPLIASIVSSQALAQTHNQPVYQTGKVTPGHPLLWKNNGVAGDAGGALNGTLQSLGITPLPTNPLPPFCINDSLISNPNGYHEMCVSANDLGAGGQLTFGALGGAANTPLTVRSGNKLVMTSGAQNVAFQNLPQTVAGDVPVCIDNTTGQLYQASATDRYILLTDEASANYLTDEAGANYLAAFIPAGSCIQQ